MDMVANPLEAGTHRRQITMSPYYGRPDFSSLAHDRAAKARLDDVSLADLLRNGFVYPPNSIFTDTKLATFGFDPRHDMYAAPRFHFDFHTRGKGEATDAQDWMGTYHRLLCDAYRRACAEMRAPWLLQSGGKDSTQLAIIAAEVRPDTTCITYLGGEEENEVASARYVARELGLRHEVLTCDPGRAYDRYLALLPRMPLLTADFALLSYVDLATDVLAAGGDGVVDGMGADNYFGIPVGRLHRWLSVMARHMQLPSQLFELPVIGRNFEICYLLSTLQMDPIERDFPGSRFTDAEVDALFGRGVSAQSRARLAVFREEIASAANADERCNMALTVAGSAGGFAKGLYTTSALSLQAAYPFCDPALRDWVYRQVPSDQLVDPVTRTSKVLMRRHIARRFGALPYVQRKGSFRFDLRGLARTRFEHVRAQAQGARELLPGAVHW
ncbi:MAG TPA: asparagine synthase-related protein, partial [Xanthomonadaceae bacterium]|nr:asparagine synthase-related protein [Xanthomonadaceae bacterium]